MSIPKDIQTVIQAPGNRNEEITRDYLAFLDQHIGELLEGRETEMLHINEIAQKLFISPVHLSNTVKLVTGRHPCYYFDLKIIQQANHLLAHTALSASEVARRLTFDPSNFLKFYKKLTGLTPTEFREGKGGDPRTTLLFVMDMHAGAHQ